MGYSSVQDKPRTGRLSVTYDASNIATFYVLVLSDRHISTSLPTLFQKEHRAEALAPLLDVCNADEDGFFFFFEDWLLWTNVRWISMSPKLKFHSKHWKYFYSPPPRTLMWYPEKVMLFFLKMMRVCCIHLFLHVVNSLFYLSSSGSIPRIFLLYGVSKVKDHFIPWAPVGEYVKGPFHALFLLGMWC